MLCAVVGWRAGHNLALAFGPGLPAWRRRWIVWRMALHLADGIAETLVFARRGPTAWHSRLDDEEARQRVAALRAAHPGGLIGLTGHLGNWELVAQWCQDRVGPITVVARRSSNRKLNLLIASRREAHGVQTLYRDEPSSQLLRVLRRGEVLGVVPDQDIPKIGGLFVELFGRPAYTPIGPARLALAAGVPICVVAILRVRGRLLVRYLGELIADPHAPREEELRRLTEGWSQLLEAEIRRHPEQWPWFHDRWKTSAEQLRERGRSEL